MIYMKIKNTFKILISSFQKDFMTQVPLHKRKHVWSFENRLI